MSARGKNATVLVSREYHAAPDACARALALLLKKPVSKEGRPPSSPDDAAKEIKNGCDAKSSIPRG